MLTRWRAGQTSEVVVKLPVLGTFSATAPFDCPKSKRILEQGLRALAARMADADYGKRLDPIPRSLNALALLAGGDPAYLPLVKREAQWAEAFSAKGFKTWYYGYVMIFLAEYLDATGDASVRPGLRRLALEAAQGQSAVGSWGHDFARPDGRLKGYGMMNAPGLPLTIGLVRARDAGVSDPDVTRAIERSAQLLRFYVGKGAVPYGDHPAWTQTHEDNGKCGMAAVLFQQLREAKSAGFFTRMALASHGGERDGGHTGNFFNMLWSLPAIAQAGPHATGAWMREFGGWYHDLARRWDGAFTHQGPPEPGWDSYRGWDASGAYLLAYALPRKKLVLTGRKPGVVQPLAPAAAEASSPPGAAGTIRTAIAPMTASPTRNCSRVSDRGRRPCASARPRRWRGASRLGWRRSARCSTPRISIPASAPARRWKHCAARPRPRCRRCAVRSSTTISGCGCAPPARWRPSANPPCRRCRNCWSASPATRRRTTRAAWSSGSSPPPSSAGC
jgi:hypothetical protein